MILTNWAFFFSTNDVTVFIPLRITLGRLVARSGLLLLACSSARCFKRSFFSGRVSGRYFSKSLNNWVDVCLSSVWVNWLIGGGTFKRLSKMLRWRWRRMYWGHLTKRVRSRLCWISKQRMSTNGNRVFSSIVTDLGRYRSSSSVFHREDWQLFSIRLSTWVGQRRFSSCLSSSQHPLFYLSTLPSSPSLWWRSCSSRLLSPSCSHLLLQTCWWLKRIEVFNLEEKILSSCGRSQRSRMEKIRALDSSVNDLKQSDNEHWMYQSFFFVQKTQIKFESQINI